MELKKCFMLDYHSRNGKEFSLKNLKELLFNPGYRVVVYYRISLYLKTMKFPKYVFVTLGRLMILRLSRVPGVEIRTRFEIGKGLHLPHPHDIVIGAGAKIGENVTIYNGVNLGANTLKSLDESKDVDTRYPTIGNGVTIFSGAKIIGAVKIGSNSIVGANSVVNSSFPPNTTIAGSPAKKISKRR